jgi:uncharacterized protein (DUF2249 family)
MKNAIKLTALLLVLSTGLFAAAPAKPVPANNDVITFASMPAHRGVEIKVEKNQPGKAVVIISDHDGNVLLKDVMPNYKSMEKGYVLNKLDNGDYTIEVTSNKQVVKKDIHIYDEDRTRVFIVKQ